MMNRPVHLIELETPRLHLRQWQDSDFLPFATMCADPEVMRYFPTVQTRDESMVMAKRCQDLIATHGWGPWAAEEKQTGNFIGFIGLHIPSMALPFSPCVEIAWRLATSYWGKGLASEAASAVLDVGFGQINLAEIVSFTALPNLKSQAVMQRIGMQRLYSFEHPNVPIGSPLRTHILFSIAQQHWLKNNDPNKSMSTHSSSQ